MYNYDSERRIYRYDVKKAYKDNPVAKKGETYIRVKKNNFSKDEFFRDEDHLNETYPIVYPIYLQKLTELIKEDNEEFQYQQALDLESELHGSKSFDDKHKVLHIASALVNYYENKYFPSEAKEPWAIKLRLLAVLAFIGFALALPIAPFQWIFTGTSYSKRLINYYEQFKS